MTLSQLRSSILFYFFLPGGYRPPDPPPWKFELIDWVLKLIKLYQASELILDFWIFWIKSYQASELILDFWIFHAFLDMYFLFGPRFWIFQSQNCYYMDHGLELISPILEILEIWVCNILQNPGNIGKRIFPNFYYLGIIGSYDPYSVLSWK